MKLLAIVFLTFPYFGGARLCVIRSAPPCVARPGRTHRTYVLRGPLRAATARTSTSYATKADTHLD